MLVPERLAPLMLPEATIELGVIAPKVKVIAGVVVAVATVPETPLAVTTETLVTVPDPPPVEAIVRVLPLGVIVMPEPAARVTAPVRLLMLLTPELPPPPFLDEYEMYWLVAIVHPV